MSVTIRARPRGALIVEGEFELYDTKNEKVDLCGRKKVALCRCGASRTRPLCDGSHNRISFEPEPSDDTS